MSRIDDIPAIQKPDVVRRFVSIRSVPQGRRACVARVRATLADCRHPSKIGSEQLGSAE